VATDSSKHFQKYTKIVSLVAPDQTSYQLLNASRFFAAGASETTTKDLTTSAPTPQTGGFQLIAQVLSGTTVVASQTIPVTKQIQKAFDYFDIV
jgi:hypothetical protein